MQFVAVISLRFILWQLAGQGSYAKGHIVHRWLLTKQHLIGPWNENILDKSSEKTRLKEEQPSVVTGCRVKGKQRENRGA